MAMQTWGGCGCPDFYWKARAETDKL